MPLATLTVNDFIFETFEEMKVPAFKKNTRTNIGFYGKSSKFPMHVAGSERLETVYKKLCSIVE